MIIHDLGYPRIGINRDFKKVVEQYWKRETEETALPAEVKHWMAFFNQKLKELDQLKKFVLVDPSDNEREQFAKHQNDILGKGKSRLVYNESGQEQMLALDESMQQRDHSHIERRKQQQRHIDLPDLFPVTTIGSFPQNNEIGPGAYDIHSPCIPSADEMLTLLDKAADVSESPQVCGLIPIEDSKREGGEETLPSLKNMVEAARRMHRKRTDQQ